MNKTLTTTAVAAVLLASLTACSGKSSSASEQTSDGKSGSSAAPAVSKLLTASTAFTGISGRVASARLSGTVTAANDPNHLLGRPGQYTSKVTFNDTRIKAGDVEGSDKGDVDRGGAIEAFAHHAEAKARAEYIQGFAKSMPALAEYDYVHGTVLVRVSHYLTPQQAAAYKTAADALS
ncbi:hypothetical protein [Streptomyces collinus]|uniref:hypothetical protein n=1 Tax=Streptomyces collinus TaxID=42684 RepID=UPI00369C477C